MRSSQSVGQSLVTRQEEELLVSERRAALREAFADLSSCCQQLIEDPPMPYAQISAKLGIPIGSIGPTVSAAWPSCVGTRPLQQ